MGDHKRGVYLCRGCGIGDAISLDDLDKVATEELGIGQVRRHDCMCSDDGVARIRQDIESSTVDRAVIVACSPRVMTDRFRFDGTPVIRTNVREHVVWSHPGGDEDTQMMATDGLRMAVAEAANTQSPEPRKEGPFSERIMVVGGGITGLTAAREASASGYEVLLVERSNALGGWSRQWSKRMPHRPPYRGLQDNDMESLIKTVEDDAGITVLTGASVARTEGNAGPLRSRAQTPGRRTL